jgi:hypothetical protein
VIQGSHELTSGTDVTPSRRPQNLERLQCALETLNARRPDGDAFDLGEELDSNVTCSS